VKAHQIAGRPPGGKQPGEAPIGEDPLDEVVAEPGIGQPPFFLDRQVGKLLDERRGEQPAAAAGGRAVAVVDLHPLEATAW
jgi:hypothetical protein